MASNPDFKLVSAATAIAIIASPEHHPEINKLRSVHDKAYHKWQPHINILYPFVQAPQFDDAVMSLKSALQKANLSNINIKIDEVGVFRHRKNATLFLKPDSESTKRIGELRKCLVEALGREESDGTHDGVFRPHLTIGQAGLQGDSVERLSDKIQRLVRIEWECSSLAVLKRKTTGEMELVEMLPLGDGGSEQRNLPLHTTTTGSNWSPCFSSNEKGEWEAYQQAVSIIPPDEKSTKEMTIATYNLMTEPTAPPFMTRFPLILEAITSAIRSGSGLQVLCLQEVNNEILPLLLTSPRIRKLYPYSTHAPSAIFESKRNIVTLASEPFTSFTLKFAERHKSSLVIQFLDSDITIANVHLTSALTDVSVAVKTRQMTTLTDFLKKESGPIFVAGDFNLTSSPKTIETALARRIITPSTATAIKNVVDTKIWDDAFMKYIETDSSEEHDDSDGELDDAAAEGVTFDRLNNPLAALSKGPIDDIAQRYDRILWARNEVVRVEVESVERFGFPDERGMCGSDHYGVCATMALTRSASSSNEMPIRGPTSDVLFIQDETDIASLLKSYLPTEGDRAQRVSAINVLKETLGGDVILAPLGSYAMDTYFSSSDIDLLVIGTASPQRFFETAQEQLKALGHGGDSDGEGSSEDGIKGLHFVNSLVPIIEVVVRGIKIDLQYCQATELVSRYNSTPQPGLQTLVFEDELISILPPSSLRPLNTYRDTAYLLNTLPDRPTYRLTHRYLSLYLKNRGLYSAKFGYLGGIHLSLLLNKIVKYLPSSTSAASIIRSFFAYYATFNWAGEIVADPAADKDRISRSSREAIVIQSIHAPTARPNVASSCTRLSAASISKEFAVAMERLGRGEWEWCLRAKSDSVSDFFNGFGAFVKVTLDMWNLDDIGGEKVREVIGGLESKITGLMVGLGRIDKLEGRVWPERFSEAKGGDDGDQIKAIYLVGISAKGGDEEERRLIFGKVLQASRFFERTVMEMRGFEVKRMWVGVEVVSRRKVLAEGFVVNERTV